MALRTFAILGSCLILAQASSPDQSFGVLQARQAPTGSCSTGVHVIAAGGGNSTDEYAYGLLGSLAQSIVNRIPGSDMVSLPYDKEDIADNPQAIPGGLTNLVSYVNGYHAACPDNKIVLVGYSSGAIILMNGLCSGGLDQGLADSTIIATVVYGDETRVPGLPYDLGTCTGSGVGAAHRNPAGCGAYIPGVQSYCDLNDPQCCDGPQEDFEVHFVYPGKYDVVATNWVQSRWELLGGGGASNTTSSSATTNSTTATGTETTSAESTATHGALLVATAAATTTSASSPSSTITMVDSNGSWSVSPSFFWIGMALFGTLTILRLC